ncbi:MAG: carboxypeptidase M32 [Anaerolineales bacterium]|nr:MAG: carboxypeptidase M32 [Anaerolineales bacterium]
MEKELNTLIERLQEVDDLESASAVLDWDQATYLPPEGAAARGRQLATLGRLAHEKFTDPLIGTLLDKLQTYEKDLPYDSDDASLIRATRRQYEKKTKVPSAFMSEFYQHTAECYAMWVKARPNNDFKSVQPLLEKTLDLSRQLANFFPGYEHIADPLIDYSDYGMKASTVQNVFGELRCALVPMVESILSQQPADDTCLHRAFPEDKQEAFFVEVVKDFGFDFERGRQDKSPHPFTTNFSSSDVRFTVRYKQNDLSEALFSALHETGHALYEQGVDPKYDGSTLANGTSSGVHESQSRLWENVIGRSRGFWDHYYPKCQMYFPVQLGDVPIDTFYRAINKVQRSLIRTDADEVTYNLHVMLRFDFELALLEGKLAVKDLPDAWNARYKTDLGIEPPDNRDGVLQDVHWYGGPIGGSFQGYTLGNILTAQFYQAAVLAHPEIPNEITQGKFNTLLSWLQTNIYRHGSKYTAPELIERVTGDTLQVGPYIQYLTTKYGELYAL